MAQYLKLEVVTPEKEIVNEDAQVVMAPGTMGEFGVLAGHTPFVSTLNVGILRYKDTSGQERSIFVNGGFAEALPDKVTILAESAERRRDINLDRAVQAKERAEKRLSSGSSVDVDYTRARAALNRAIHRIKISQSH